MKKLILISLLLVLKYNCKAQEKYIFNFEKLPIIDSIYSQKQIAEIKNKSEQFFYLQGDFISQYRSNEDLLITVLLKKNKKDNNWTAYNLHIEEETLHNFFSIIGLTNSNYFLCKSIENSIGGGAGGGSESRVDNLRIIDVNNATYTEIVVFDYFFEWSLKDEQQSDVKHLINSEYFFDNNKLTILNTCFQNSEINICSNAGGVYEISNQKIVKTKFYDAKFKKMRPITYAGDIAIGMKLTDIQLVYPDVEFKEVSNKYGTCADDFKTGFEIWNKGDLLAFAITDKDDKDRILNLIILSSKINFNNINTSLKLEEVLKLYPKSTLEEDSLSEWEYVYIHELKIKVVFQTDETNQIGRYDQDGKLIQLKRKNVKIDFIEF